MDAKVKDNLNCLILPIKCLYCRLSDRQKPVNYCSNYQKFPPRPKVNATLKLKKYEEDIFIENYTRDK